MRFDLVVGGADHAVIDRELVGRHRQQAGRHLDQHAARFRRRHAHLLAAELNAGGAGGAALVHLVAVSPMMTLTLLNGTSSSSATIWPMATCSPWPMSILPKNADTLPSALTAM